jgi:protein-L-isoaspartate(D-aspartate) O-methyltransferase
MAMTKRSASLGEIRRFHARAMAVASRSSDARLERVFELVPREAFLPPGPWQIKVDRQYVETPSADPVYIYQNNLVALDAEKGINNGEPFLHAAFIGAIAPQSGDVVCHVGAGTGYYTALLAMLTLPGGRVHAYEIEEDLARKARQNLEPFEIASVTHGDATRLPLPPYDLIYVNAGVVSPPISWLGALRPGGRMIFPWRPQPGVGLAVLLTRAENGFAVKPLMPAWFIPCVGASGQEGCTRAPSPQEAWSVRSAWLTADRPPDDTAVAIYPGVWFARARDREETGPRASQNERVP